MAVFDFPHRQRLPRRRPAPRAFGLVEKMRAGRERQKALAAERRRLSESLSALERLSGEVESIQADLERLRAALVRRAPKD